MRVKLLHLVTAQSCRIYDTCAYGCALFLHGFGNPQRAVPRQTAPSASEEEAVNKEATSGAPLVLIRVSVVVPFEPKGDDVSYVHDGTKKTASNFPILADMNLNECSVHMWNDGKQTIAERESR